MNKEEYDKHMMEKLHNLLHDQKSYNMNFRDMFHSWEEAAMFMSLELVEVEASLEMLKGKMQIVLDLLSAKQYEKVSVHMKHIAEESEHLAQESLHVGAVALKSIYQLEKALTDCNQ